MWVNVVVQHSPEDINLVYGWSIIPYSADEFLKLKARTLSL
jgi:hypothetical protein